ncbi:MAG: chromosome segregation protein SMC [Acidobacteria bacterium]|nr:chromosome segregation protein SMC [Acidobacteriota bacterium]
MKLQKLEIQGFKSFHDYQVMDFKPGVTGIVGPNGCGKSNISDAISWVLGTQSALQLRGKRMDDLIFNGSRTRKPLGLAQVKMQIRAENGDIPGLDDEVVEIGRRLFRTGDSDYLLNGKACRLKDILDIIMDTGLGTTTYTVIEQGKIDQILSSNSADRRGLLEEAAGITRFKSKRHQTDLKLQATQQNLLRLHDIMQEIEKQVRALARQAGKARKYRRLREELMGHQLLVYIHEYFGYFGRQEEALRRISSLKDHEVTIAAMLASREAETEQLKSDQIDREEELSQAKEKVFKLELNVNNIKRTIEENKRRIADSKLLIGRNEKRIAEFEERLKERRSRIEEENRVLEETGKKADEEQEKLDNFSETVSDKNKHHRELEEQWDKVSREHLDIIGRIAELQSLLVKTNSELEQESSRIQRNENEFSDLNSLLKETRDKHHSELRASEDLKEEIEYLKSENSIRSGKLIALKETKAKKTEEIIRLKQRITGLESEIETLKTMQLSDSEKYTAGAFLFDLEKEGYKGLEGYLLEKISVPEKYRKGIERFLGDSVKYFIGSDLKTVLDIGGLLKKDKEGRAAFYIREYLENKQPFSTLEIDGKPGVVSSLHRELKGRGDFAYLVTRLFEDAYIVDKIDSSESTLSLLQEADLVSVDGDILRHNGVLITGEDQAEKIKLLDLQSNVREKEQELETIFEEFSQAESEEDKLQTDFQEMEKELAEYNLRAVEAERRFSVVDEKVRSLEEEISRLESKKEILESESVQIKKDRERLAENHKHLEEEFKALEAEKDSIISKKENIRGILDKTKGELDDINKTYNDMKIHLNQLNLEKKNKEASIRQMEENISEIESQIEERADESQEAEKFISDYSSEMGTLAEELIEKEAKLEEYKSFAREKEVEFRNLQAQVLEAEQYLKTVRKQHQDEVKSINSLELELTEFSLSLRNIEENCRKELGREITEHLSLYSAQELSEKIEDIKKQVHEIGLRLSALGEVNLTAFEEYEKAKERLEFYRQQEKDVLDSVDSLEKVIDKLETESRKRFLEAFETINSNFKEIYAKLFEGGRAELSLPENEDILECPILISAQPPGKRLQSISLLSGGEKAMTSIALLFGIFRFKPSPFCLLDEVDATLDEINTGRFIKMIKEYSDRTQFLLITHNKRTMEIAEVLYGVTMEEPGVSKLVSVSFIDESDSLKAVK